MVPRKNLAGRALGIRTQVSMQKTEDLLMVFTKPSTKTTGQRAGKNLIWPCWQVQRKARLWLDRFKQKGLVRREQVRRKGRAKEPRRTRMVQDGEEHPIRLQDGEVWGNSPSAISVINQPLCT
uniref:Uncharacterized protein n=1 Tax=Molossus molossus TaxID=27622 RepID=A0A7J8DQ66_MOLMO|nr:hypothetical protein HJG59_009243 [Molossus molossus]